jgi:Protein of unknown function (DUF3551)
MRMISMGLAAITLLQLVGVEPASAEPRPWCLVPGRGGPGGGIPDCSYHSLQQCMASVGGGADRCSENPALAWDRLEGKRAPQPPRSRNGRGY